MSRRSLAAVLPITSRRALRKLGEDLRDARRRRRIPTALMAERASISRTTLAKAEKGDPAVSIGTYAMLLFVLGLTNRLEELADVRGDEVGRSLDEGRLPKRIRFRRRDLSGEQQVGPG